MTDKVPAILGAIHAVQSELGPLQKDGDYDAGNTQYKFLSANAVIGAVQPLLNKHKIIVTTQLVDAHPEFFTAEPEAAKPHVRVPKRQTHAYATYQFDFYSVEDGSSVTTTVLSEATDTGDKGARNLAVSATKIAFLQQFVIESGEPDGHELNTLGRVDEDDKPTAASRRVEAARTSAPVAQKAAPKPPTSRIQNTNAAKDAIREKFLESGKYTGPEVNEMLQAKKTELGQSKIQTSTYEAVLADLTEKHSGE